MRREERRSFARHSGLGVRQIDVLDVFGRPDFPPDIAAGYDALFVGGASEASVLEPDVYPFVGPAIDCINHCVDRDLPVFASCFGFQLAVLVFGGEVIRDTADFEMGTLPIRVTGAAREDSLFCDMPREFRAVSVHEERSTQLPADCRLLAETDFCCHAFWADGKRFWCFQFHPEVDKAALIKRLTVYKVKYTHDDEHLAQVLAAAAETPESNALPRRFVDRVLLG